MRNRKKILAWLLAVCLMVSLLPMSVMAEGNRKAAFEPLEIAIGFEPAAEQAAEAIEPQALPTKGTESLRTSDGEEDENALTDYATFLTLLQQLESLADAYGAANEKSGYGLVLNYIRTGAEKYTDSLWAGVAGAEEEDFVAYVQAQDEANGANVSALRNLGNVAMPNGNSIEIVHLFAVLDIANYQSRNTPDVAQPYKDFGGWLGDLGDLLYQVQKGNVDCTTDFEAGVQDIRENYLGVNLGRNCFDMQDIRGDLDAVYLMTKHDETGSPVSTLIEEYYTDTLADTDRAIFYMADRYPELNAIAPTRAQVYKDYYNNLMAFALETKREIDRVRGVSRLGRGVHRPGCGGARHPVAR